MLMAKLFQELKLHNKFPFEVKFVVMDPGYSPENRKVIEELSLIHIWLRKKLENVGMEGRIKTKKGIGYYLDR